MTNPKRPESLDRAIVELEYRVREFAYYDEYQSRHGRAKVHGERIAELQDALDVLRAERERRERCGS